MECRMECRKYTNSILKQNNIKLKYISCTSCAGIYCLDGFGYKEIKAHCKWCAISEYVLSNVTYALNLLKEIEVLK